MGAAKCPLQIRKMTTTGKWNWKVACEHMLNEFPEFLVGCRIQQSGLKTLVLRKEAQRGRVRSVKECNVYSLLTWGEASGLPLFFLQSSFESLYIVDYCHCNMCLFLFRVAEFPRRAVSVPVWHGRLWESLGLLCSWVELQESDPTCVASTSGGWNTCLRWR